LESEELEEVRRSYVAGELMTGGLKAKCIAVLQEFVVGFQERKRRLLMRP
jgi:tryptophanyl-tRNA synthetase